MALTLLPVNAVYVLFLFVRAAAAAETAIAAAAPTGILQPVAGEFDLLAALVEAAAAEVEAAVLVEAGLV